MTDEQRAAQERRRELKEAKTPDILDVVDLHNQVINAELKQTSFRHQHIERFHFKEMYHPNQDCRLRLYMTRVDFFFIEEDTKLKRIRKTWSYASLERAMQVYDDDGFHWVEEYSLTKSTDPP
jgi:hypothetical protein